MDKFVLTVKDVAKLLSTSEFAVYKMVQRGQLPSRRMGKRIYFLREELEEFFKSLPKNDENA